MAHQNSKRFFIVITAAAAMVHKEVAFFKYAIRSALSFCFLIPAKIIFVPGMYFLGFSKYSISVLSLQVTPKKNPKTTEEKQQNARLV